MYSVYDKYSSMTYNQELTVMLTYIVTLWPLADSRSTFSILDEDILLDGLSPSEPEQESDDGLPRIGRQKKKQDSDSDFRVDEDSGSDWDEGSRAKKGVSYL